MTDINSQELRDSWARVSKFGDRVPLRFYTKLFLAHPDLRDLFPIDMSEQRDKLWDMVNTLVDHLDNLDRVVPAIAALGDRHKGYGVQPSHFPLVGGALLATLKHFETDKWSEDLELWWSLAYGAAAEVMINGNVLEASNVH